MHFDHLDEIYAMVKSNMHFEHFDLTGLTGWLTGLDCRIGYRTNNLSGRFSRLIRPVGFVISAISANFGVVPGAYLSLLAKSRPEHPKCTIHIEAKLAKYQELVPSHGLSLTYLGPCHFWTPTTALDHQLEKRVVSS